MTCGARPAAALIPVVELRELIAYNPETGELTRKQTGKSAGYLVNGYRYLRVAGKVYKASRVAFALMSGRWPTSLMDHVNGVSSDDRWCNLREATQFENMQNLGRMGSNTSGFRGATFKKQTKRWQAHISVNGRQHHLGYFASAEEAHAAHLRAKAELHTFNPTLRRSK